MLETTQDMLSEKNSIGYKTADWLVHQLHEHTDSELHTLVDFGAGRPFHDLLDTLTDDEERIVAETNLHIKLDEAGLAAEALFAPEELGFMDKFRLGPIGANIFGEPAQNAFLRLPLAEQVVSEAAVIAYQQRVKARIPLVSADGDPNYLAVTEIIRAYNKPQDEDQSRNKLVIRSIGSNVLTHGVAALRYRGGQEYYDRTDPANENRVTQQAAEYALSPDNTVRENIFTTVPLRVETVPGRENMPVDSFGLVENVLGIIWRAGQPRETS